MPISYKNISKFPGYSVGSDGSIWSCWKIIPLGRGNGTKSTKTNEWKKLRCSPHTTSGYLRVVLWRDRKSYHRYVHRIVIEMFIGLCPENMECRHLDGDKSNARLSNLAWGSPIENALDKLRHGTDSRGIRNGNAKLNEQDLFEVRRRATQGESQRSIAKSFNITQGHVSNIINGKQWRHV